jgi:tRNA pseudouridine55 synthase
MLDRIILIDKPKDWTSFDVVAKIRGYFSKQEGYRVRVGHAGTLDPFATGLLIVLVGKATKIQDSLMKKDKEYIVDAVLGKVSTTGDPEGEVSVSIPAGFSEPTKEEVAAVAHKFIGRISQVPPKYSAIKVNGERAYNLARKGEEVVIAPRAVQILELEVIKYDWPHLTLRVSCSSGTYIRTLVEDIGKELGCGAYAIDLQRTKIGTYLLAEAKTVEEVISGD